MEPHCCVAMFQSGRLTVWSSNQNPFGLRDELANVLGVPRSRVRVLVPSRNDHPWVTLLTRRYYRRLLMNGVRVWEWKGEMMHAKTSVVDSRWVRVGSTDFDMLGVAINYELDALVEDPEIGREAEERFLTDLEDSHEVTMRSRVVSHEG